MRSTPVLLPLLIGKDNLKHRLQVSEIYLDALLGNDSKFGTPPTSKERAFAAHQVSTLKTSFVFSDEKARTGNTEVASITVLFTSCLTGLD